MRASIKKFVSGKGRDFFQAGQYVLAKLLEVGGPIGLAWAFSAIVQSPRLWAEYLIPIIYLVFATAIGALWGRKVLNRENPPVSEKNVDDLRALIRNLDKDIKAHDCRSSISEISDSISRLNGRMGELEATLATPGRRKWLPWRSGAPGRSTGE